MGFSPVQYQTLIDKIEHGIADVESALNHAVATISADTSWIPGVGQAIGALLDKLVSLVQEFLREIVQLLKPFKVPLIMDQYGASWLSVHQHVAGPGGWRLRPEHRPAGTGREHHFIIGEHDLGYVHRDPQFRIRFLHRGRRGRGRAHHCPYHH